jgi:hypothetical protein
MRSTVRMKSAMHTPLPTPRRLAAVVGVTERFKIVIFTAAAFTQRDDVMDISSLGSVAIS